MSTTPARMDVQSTQACVQQVTWNSRTMSHMSASHGSLPNELHGRTEGMLQRVQNIIRVVERASHAPEAMLASMVIKPEERPMRRTRPTPFSADPASTCTCQPRAPAPPCTAAQSCPGQLAPSNAGMMCSAATEKVLVLRHHGIASVPVV